MRWQEGLRCLQGYLPTTTTAIPTCWYLGFPALPSLCSQFAGFFFRFCPGFSPCNVCFIATGQVPTDQPGELVAVLLCAEAGYNISKNIDIPRVSLRWVWRFDRHNL